VWHEATLDDDGVTVSNAPEGSGPGTLQAIIFLPQPIKVEAGDVMPFVASHDETNFHITFPTSTPAPEVDEDVDLTVSSVSRWHWGMMHDEGRNGVYDTVIRKAVAGCDGSMRALDIGSGSGLLAMMLARAGAQNITTVEAVKPISLIAGRITRNNGYGDAITVVNKMSTEMVIGEDMPCKADLCVSEIVDVGLLGEFCLPTMQHARANLLNEGAKIMPCAATVYACLVQVARRKPIALRRPLSGNPEDEGGFNLSNFNTFASETYEQIGLNSLEHVKLTEPFEVFDFDLTGLQELERERTQRLTTITDGVVHAVCFWFTLHLDEETHFSTAPKENADEETCWKQALFFYPEPALEVHAGDQVDLKMGHEPNRIYFEAPTAAKTCL